jgi:hypothetical protein
MASATHGEATTEHQSAQKFNQTNVFEFLPNTEITSHEVVELTRIVRIGVSGEKIAEMSPGLQKYFVQVKND